MPDNQQPSPGGFFALPDHRVLSIDGLDAVAFAHAQFMNDVAGLPLGWWQWNGWLTPKGRAIALFALLKRDAESIWLVVHGVDTTALMEQLQRLVFRRKAVVAVADQLQVLGTFENPVAARAARIVCDATGAVELDVSGDGGSRSLRIVEKGSCSHSDPDLARWKAFDLAHGLPWLSADQQEQWTPQQLSLDRLRAYSVKKGCYPGQEIVARTHFLGQAKRGLVLLEADEALSPGDEVSADGRPLGSVISVANVGSRQAALAVLPSARESTALSIGGAPVRERPLTGGLQR